MPMHDWTRVEAGIYHDLHLEWISKIKSAINHQLPSDYYALAEQRTGILGPDVLKLQRRLPGSDQHPWTPHGNGKAATVQLTKPVAKGTGSAAKYYFNKQRTVTIRHVSDDRLIAIVELVSPGNVSKSSVVEEFVYKALCFLKQGVHVSFVNPFPPNKHVPFGLHGAIWESLTGESESFVTDQEPLEVVVYSSSEDTEFFAKPFAVGMALPSMPVFLTPDEHVLVPLEETYEGAFEAVPARWREVVAGEGRKG